MTAICELLHIHAARVNHRAVLVFIVLNHLIYNFLSAAGPVGEPLSSNDFRGE